MPSVLVGIIADNIEAKKEDQSFQITRARYKLSVPSVPVAWMYPDVLLGVDFDSHEMPGDYAVELRSRKKDKDGWLDTIGPRTAPFDPELGPDGMLHLISVHGLLFPEYGHYYLTVLIDGKEIGNIPLMVVEGDVSNSWVKDGNRLGRVNTKSGILSVCNLPESNLL